VMELCLDYLTWITSMTRSLTFANGYIPWEYIMGGTCAWVI